MTQVSPVQETVVSTAVAFSPPPVIVPQPVANPTASFETAAPADPYPSFTEMVHKFEIDLCVSGTNPEVADQVCKELGVSTARLALLQKVQKVYGIMYRSTGARTQPGAGATTTQPGAGATATQPGAGATAVASVTDSELSVEERAVEEPVLVAGIVPAPLAHWRAALGGGHGIGQLIASGTHPGYSPNQGRLYDNWCWCPAEGQGNRNQWPVAAGRPRQRSVRPRRRDPGPLALRRALVPKSL